VNCPCGEPAERLSPYFAAGETDFRLCPTCGCVLRERFPDPEELEAIYRQAYEEEKIVDASTQQESGDHATGSYADYLARHMLAPGDRMLDYGAGSGALVAAMRERGNECDGVEFAASARKFCFDIRGISLEQNLDGVPDSRYRAVSMIEVIEHLTDLTQTLEELHRVLAPGGRLFVTTPNRNGIRARLEGGRWREARKKFHLFLFDRDSLRFHLERAGFVGVRQIFYSPLQKKGWKFALYARTMQTFRMPGTLCFLASRQT
jgi:ubiquinone/menaquinone biosynthesis C-methylase UbiE